MSEVRSPIVLDSTGQEIARALTRVADRMLGDSFASAGYHNSRFRGANLGGTFTAEQSAAIKAGTFDDLYVGDYWEIGGVKYRIAGFNLWLNTGDVQLTTNHAVIVPDTNLYTAQMNSTNDTTGAYALSEMKQTNLGTALTTFENAFGAEHILHRKTLLANATSGGSASGWAWYDTQIDLMTEAQVYGVRTWGAPAHNGYDIGEKYSRFPLFTLAPEFITNRSWYWLQDVYSAAAFCYVSNGGDAYNNGASYSDGVRPAVAIA